MTKEFCFRNYKFEVGKSQSSDRLFYAARHKPVRNKDGKVVKGIIEVRYFDDKKLWDDLSSSNLADYQAAKLRIRHLFSQYEDITMRLL